VAANLDADPALEICALIRGGSSGGVLTCEDGATGELEWWVDFPSNTGVVSLRVAELDSDPAPELLVGAYPAFVYAFDGETGWLKWRTPPLEQSPNAPLTVLRTADLDGDSAIEVVAAAADDYYGLFTAFDPDTGSLRYGPHYIQMQSLETLQLDADPQFEVVIGSEYGDVRPLDPVTGTVGSPVLSVDGAVDGLRFADFTRDGVADALLIVNGALRLLDGTTDVEIWRSPFLGENAGRYDRLAVIDYDRDSLPEIAVDLEYGFAFYEAPEFDVFADGFESGDTSAWSSTSP
jgi:hypothetical protein